MRTMHEQIEMALSGRALTLLRETFGAPPYPDGAYSRVIAFTREDAIKYVVEKGFPAGSYTRGHGPQDGIHLVADGEEWAVYFQERGVRFNEFRSKEAAEVQEAMVDLMLGLAGLGGAVEFKPSGNT